MLNRDLLERQRDILDCEAYMIRKKKCHIISILPSVGEVAVNFQKCKKKQLHGHTRARQILIASMSYVFLKTYIF